MQGEIKGEHINRDVRITDLVNYNICLSVHSFRQLSKSSPGCGTKLLPAILEVLRWLEATVRHNVGEGDTYSWNPLEHPHASEYVLQILNHRK